MKKIALIITILLCSSQFIYSQYGWYTQQSGTMNRLNHICTQLNQTPGSIFWIAGNNGVILKSTNYGVNWFTQSSGTNANLNSIWFCNESTGLAAGDNGTILKTINGGNNWIPLISGVTSALNDVSGSVIYSVPPDFSPWVVGDGGKILYSTNQGVSWTQSQSGLNSNLHSIIVIDAPDLYCAGDGGKIMLTANAGGNWISINSGTNQNLNAIYLCGTLNSFFLAAGNNGTLLRSPYGTSWSQENSGVNSNLNAIALGSYVYAAGDGGKILRSTDSGFTWDQETSNTSANLHSVLFINSNTGWAVGDNGVIVHTTTDVYSVSSNRLNARTINTGFRNDGFFNCDSSLQNAPGFEWPKGQDRHARFISALWIGAVIGSDTIVSSADMGSCYLPGYTDNNGQPNGADEPDYRIYKLSYGVNDSDRAKWPNVLLGNSNQGAPVYYDAISGLWKPVDFGDQTIFYTYTDSYLFRHDWATDSVILKADIKQLNYSLYFPAISGDVIISQFTIINRNNTAWNSAYLTIRTDDDLGDPEDDVTGCDTTLQIGFTYNGMDYDTAYGIAPPAVSFNLLKGPSMYTGNNNDTDFVCNGKTRVLRTGFKPMGMTVFNNYRINEDPFNLKEQYHYMSGYDIDDNPRINPITGLETKFMYTGDPEAGEGWVQHNLDDQRFMISMGPLTMNPGDTQVVVVAQVIAKGTSNLNSVTKLKQYAQIVRNSYMNCFTDVPIYVRNESQVPFKYSLGQNYPNPFNPTTTISYQIAKTVPVKIIVYDVIGRVIATLINNVQNPGAYKIDWNGTNFASGVYFYRLTAGDFSDVKKMVLIK